MKSPSWPDLGLEKISILDHDKRIPKLLDPMADGAWVMPHDP